MILQAQSFGVFETLTQYGALGVITLGLGAALWFLLKRQIASEDRLKSKVEELQKEINDYIKQDQNKIKETVENNTKALDNLKEIIILSGPKSRK
jgi:apolipoprotein N-acyltransferase